MKIKIKPLEWQAAKISDKSAQETADSVVG